MQQATSTFHVCFKTYLSAEDWALVSFCLLKQSWAVERWVESWSVSESQTERPVILHRVDKANSNLHFISQWLSATKQHTLLVSQTVHKHFNEQQKRSPLQYVMACKLCGTCILVRDFFLRDHVWLCGVSSWGFLIDCKRLSGNCLSISVLKQFLYRIRRILSNLWLSRGIHAYMVNLADAVIWYK